MINYCNECTSNLEELNNDIETRRNENRSLRHELLKKELNWSNNSSELKEAELRENIEPIIEEIIEEIDKKTKRSKNRELVNALMRIKTQLNKIELIKK